MSNSFRRAPCQYFSGVIAVTIIGVSAVTHGGDRLNHITRQPNPT